MSLIGQTYVFPRASQQHFLGSLTASQADSHGESERVMIKLESRKSHDSNDRHDEAYEGRM
jgi:hypothetical protein